MNQNRFSVEAETRHQSHVLGLPSSPKDSRFCRYRNDEHRQGIGKNSSQHENDHYNSDRNIPSSQKPLPRIPNHQNVQSAGANCFAGCVPFDRSESDRRKGRPKFKRKKVAGLDKRVDGIGKFIDNYHRNNQQKNSSSGEISAGDAEFKLKGWPTGPLQLKKRDINSIIVHVGECIMALLPVAFIVLCALAARLNKTSTSNNTLGHNVTVALQLGPTLFPIIFAAVVSRTLRIVARLGAQRGSKLGTLEMLLASQNVFGALSSQILLRTVTLVGFFLLIVWSLSPLGGQASLRLLSTTLVSTVENVNIRYLDTGPASLSFGTLLSGSTSAQLALVSTIYSALLIAPRTVKISPMDTWGNIKIPRLESLNGTDADSEGWIAVPALSSVDNYSSLIGVPVVGLQPGQANFSVEASYLSLQCRPPAKFSLAHKLWKSHLGVVWGGSDPADPWQDSIPSSQGTNMSTMASFFLDTNLSIQDDARINAGLNLSNSQSDPAENNALLSATRNIMFASMIPGAGLGQFMLANCSVFETHVEAMVNCKNLSDCTVPALRQSRQNTIPGRYTPLDSGSVTTNLFKQLPWATGAQQQSGVSSPTELFMMNPDLPSSIFYSAQNNYTNLSILSPDTLAIRLSLVLNTFYQASLAPLAFSGDLPTNLSLYGPDFIPVNLTSLPSSEVTVISNAPMISRATLAKQSQASEVYVCKTLWASLLLVCSGTLFLIGVTGIVARMHNLVPDMLGFVSSMTYDHPFIPLPAGAGPLDGMERARALRDLRVRIADVKGLDSIGHVALTAVSSRNSGIGPWITRELDAGRKYN